MTDLPLGDLARALDATGVLVARVRADQLDAPTPCAGWTVRDLLRHLSGGDRLIARLLGAEVPPHADDADPSTTYQRSAAVLLAAFARPGVAAEMVDAPVGTVPVPVLLHIRITETLVHGWDLAWATGQPVQLPSDLAAAELAFTAAALPMIPTQRRTFADPRPVAENAPAIDRLAALLGRDVARPVQHG
ncbi:MAG: hypothetical protein JWM48_537 [Mycobacterium sp.]|nr:hypothetical protein [Mycobacterium sp.]